MHFTLSFFTSGLFAQSAKISGTVKSQSGEKLVGVSLVLEETPRGAMTDLEGLFLIESIPPGNYTLKVSYLGFEAQEKEVNLSANEKVVLDFTLREKAEDLHTVTVIGKSVVGQVREQAYAVSAVSTADLYISTSDAQQILDGVSGVRIMEDGGLGSDVNFSLNGFSGDQVRFFMDGIPRDHYGSALGLSNIPVNSIDRIEVYKGVVPV